MDRGISNRAAALHVLGLWAIAAAHPLLDVLGRSPEFFVAHRAGASEILLLAGVLLLPVPLLIAAAVAAAGVAGPKARLAAAAVAIGLLAALAIVPVLRLAGMETWWAALGVACVAGVLAGGGYFRLHALRTFFTVLGVAIVAVPLAFVLRPGIRSMVLPQAPSSGSERAQAGAVRPVPVVLIVLDELPLVSLLDADRRIDPVFYPNLSALAGDGVWFRNATTVSDYTRWALPAILTGQRPEAADVPTASDHPDTLFTFLARTHRHEVFEAVTDLCPADLCTGREESFRERALRVAGDLRILAAYVFLTPDLQQALRLPELTGDWGGFDPAGDDGAGDDAAGDDAADVEEDPDAWKRRWRRAREQNPREAALRFVDGVGGDDAQPTFYFMHTLLTHHPWTLLPGGQVNGPMAPLPPVLRAVPAGDEWVILQQQQRHLLQMAYVDRVIGRLVERLRSAGLYERSLVAITADHGTAFTPGRHMRSFTPETAGEIVRVPLVIKFPADVDVRERFPQVNAYGQRWTDRNAETIDIAPTIADALGAALPWTADGTSLLRTSMPERPLKVVSYAAGAKVQRYPAEGPPLEAALQRRLRWFDGAANTYRVPRPPRFEELLNREVSGLPVVDDGGGTVHVRFASNYAAFDPKAERLPFDVSGQLKLASPARDVTYLAVAVNGIVRAVTRTWHADRASWLATPPLDVWREGRNTVEIFVVEQSSPIRLRRVFRTEARPADLNLISGAAEHYFDVRQSGFYPHERSGDRFFRWTRAHARMTVPIDAGPPAAVQVHTLRAGPGTTRLVVAANDCTLYDGPAPRREWRRTFPLKDCRLEGRELTITLTSDAQRGSRGGRRLGMAVIGVSLQ